MYEELVKRLKNCTSDTVEDCAGCPYQGGYKGTYCMNGLIAEAADAIDKLVKICNSILSKYEEAAEAVIYEYSGHIDEDIDELHKEIEDYKAQINVWQSRRRRRVMLKGDCNKCIHKDLSVYSNTCMRCGLSRKNYSPITNQDAMARLSPEEFYQRMYWLLFSYGCQFNNTELAVIEWLKKEADE